MVNDEALVICFGGGHVAASEASYPPYPGRTGTGPYTALAAAPETITGPAMVNIFTMVPVIKPSA